MAFATALLSTRVTLKDAFVVWNPEGRRWMSSPLNNVWWLHSWAQLITLCIQRFRLARAEGSHGPGHCSPQGLCANLHFCSQRPQELDNSQCVRHFIRRLLFQKRKAVYYERTLRQASGSIQRSVIVTVLAHPPTGSLAHVDHSIFLCGGVCECVCAFSHPPAELNYPA